MKDSKNGASQPYKNLGSQLRQVRQQRNETVVEASGAVEIEPDVLERIEDGAERPSEDILMLLISHFDLQEQEAVRLWESAGYEGESLGNGQPRIQEQLEKAAVVLLAMDMRTVYSDGLVIDANNSGLTLNFTQQNTGGQPAPIARVGMSYEQAEQVLASLQAALLYGRHQGTRRQLPPQAS